jgi:hypothetical protein
MSTPASAGTGTGADSGTISGPVGRSVSATARLVLDNGDNTPQAKWTCAALAPADVAATSRGAARGPWGLGGAALSGGSRTDERGEDRAVRPVSWSCAYRT